jgi:hypothetical protein
MMRPAILNRSRTLAVLGSGAAVVTVALVASGCSSSHPQPGQSHSSPASSTGRIGTSSAQPGASITVSDSSGAKLDVTLKQVINPADGASQYSKPASGQHFVGVQLHVRNEAAASFENNANNETTIVLSNGKKDEADYNPIAGCGNFDNGQVKLAAGASATGCVTFQVPNGEKIAEVRYGNSVYPGITARWQLSP